MLRASFAMRSETGPLRRRNEDYVAAVGPLQTAPGVNGLYLVADGLGGHEGGDIASAMAAETVMSAFRLSQEESAVRLSVSALEERLVEVIRRANDRIYVTGMTGPSLHRNPETPGMGTTLTVVLFTGELIILGHVGDSRAYLLRAGELSQLTEDHTFVAQRVREGSLAPDQVRHHSLRNVLTQAVGTREEVDPFIRTVPVQPGDRLLLCSDGLWDALDDDTLVHLMATAEDSQRAVDHLVDEALRTDGSDNTTALVVFFDAP